MSDKVLVLRMRLSSAFSCCVLEPIGRESFEGGAIAARTTEVDCRRVFNGMCLLAGWSGKDINMIHKRAYDCLIVESEV